MTHHTAMIRHDLLRNVTNFALFQVGWFACVLFPGVGAALLALVIVGAHLAFVSQSRIAEARFILLGTAVGSLLDGLWFRLDVLAEPGTLPLWTPIWLVGLWAVFMTTLAHSLAWVGERRWLPYVLAPLAGPFAYWSATRLGDVRFPETLPSLIALAIGWLIVFPALLAIKQRFFREITPA
ncbi:DUF2878 domain-containing protein [Marinobacter bohaiensis]|uniref:DUF2878 domain-containing protein n=1 Tax=Marinobacter bohaiensis TaxID=2201898 RepID=UPI001D175BED|nr:DUF2878 domain-containing protein [Marinobacter bohaiensis]